MPVAHFGADFSEFAAETAAADAKLTTFVASTAKAGDALTKLSLVSSAGVAPVNSLKTSLSQFDGALAAAGLHVGPEIRALGELGDAAGKTAGEIGILGTAGLALGAALGGWKIGRMVAEFFGLDQAIAGATARLMGFGDVAAQTGGAKQDTINKAIKGGADAMISYTDAIAFNAKALKDWQASLAPGQALAAYEASLKTISAEVVNLTAHDRGLIDAGLALHRSTAEIAKGLSLTTEAVDTYVAALKTEADAAKTLAADNAAIAASVAKTAEAEKSLYADMRAFSTKQIQAMTKEVETEMARQRDAVGAAQMEILKMLNASDAEKHLAAIGGASSLDAQLEALQTAHQAKLAAIEQAGRAASDLGSDAWLAHTERLTNEAAGAFQTSWDAIVQASNTGAEAVNTATEGTTPPAAAAARAIGDSFSLTFAGIIENAETMAARVSTLLSDAATNQQTGGDVAGVIGFYQEIAAQKLASHVKPLGGIPSFASGGSGDFGTGTPVMLHGKESIVPFGQGGSVINVGGIAITVGSGGNPAAAGRAAAEALLARLKERGVRV